MKNINIAILGFGTVGSGVYQVIQEDYEKIIAKLKRFTGKDFSLNVKRIVEIRKASFAEDIQTMMTTTSWIF